MEDNNQTSPELLRERNFEAIEHLLGIERYDMAEKLIGEMLCLSPNDAHLHCYLAQVFLAKKNLPSAKEACDTALKLDPESFHAKLYLAAIYMDNHEHRKSEQIYLETLHSYPEEPYLYLSYSRLMYKTGHLEKAQKLLEYCLELDPEYDDAHANLALVLAERKSFFTSLLHGKKSVALSPTAETSHYNLGISFYAAGRPFKARHHLREALRLDPNDAEIEKAFLDADRATRWLALPVYYMTWLFEKIPGEQFGVWAIFVIAIYALPALGMSKKAIIIIACAYLLLVIYSWISYPLIKMWIKLRPPK